jgi:chitin disaccharide deacetylase
VTELVVNADDLGLSPGVNNGVARAHRDGIVTSSSLMVHQAAAQAAAELVQDLPRLGVGLHVDLAEWVAQPSGWAPAYAFVDDQDAVAVEKEVELQLLLFERLVGRPPDHLDSHQHAHRDEPLRSILARTAKELGIPLRHQSKFRYFGGFYGQDGNGEPLPEAITSRGLKASLTALSDDAVELCCHPAAELDFRSSYSAERLDELKTLCDPSVSDFIAAAGFTLRTFAERLTATT